MSNTKWAVEYTEDGEKIAVRQYQGGTEKMWEVGGKFFRSYRKGNSWQEPEEAFPNRSVVELLK